MFIRAHGLGDFLRILILAGVAQPELDGGEVLCLDLHRAVHVVLFVVRDLVGDESYALNVVLRDVSAFHCPLVRVEDDVPMVTRTGNDTVLETVGPLDNAILLGGDEAVLVVDPHGPREVNLSRAHRIAPFAGIVGVRIRVRALQVEEVRALAGLGSRHADFVLGGHRSACYCSANDRLTFGDSGHSSPAVYRGDGQIIRRPDDLADRPVRRELRGQVDSRKLRHSVATVNGDTGQHGSGHLDCPRLLGSPKPPKVAGLEFDRGGADP